MSRRRSPTSLPTLPASLLAINPSIRPSARALQRSRNARRGAAAKGNGGALEDQVEAELRASGMVEDVTRCDAIVHAAGERVLWREASGCDLLGVCAKGRGVAVECKSTAAPGGAVFASKAHAMVARRSRSPHVTERQREQLDAYQRVSVALLAVRFGGEVRVFPWREVSKLTSIHRDTAGAYLSVTAALESLLNDLERSPVSPA